MLYLYANPYYNGSLSFWLPASFGKQIVKLNWLKNPRKPASSVRLSLLKSASSVRLSLPKPAFYHVPIGCLPSRPHRVSESSKIRSPIFRFGSSSGIGDGLLQRFNCQMVSFILCHFAIRPKLTKNKRSIGYALNSGHIAISKLNEPLLIKENAIFFNKADAY